MPAGCFVTGTDTGAGKSYVTAAITAGLVAAGLSVHVRKPLLTGMDEPDADGAIPDHELLALAGTGEAPDEIAPLRFGPAVSPHLAAALAGTVIDVGKVVAATLDAGEGVDRLVVEGVGGLLVPISDRSSVLDLAIGLELPIVVAARPGLGTISHTRLTVEVAREAGLDVRLIVMGPWPGEPSVIEADNRETVAALTGVPVATIPFIDEPSRQAFIDAGEALPLQIATG